MDFHSAFTLATLAAAGTLFALTRLRPDAVALLVIVALTVAGVLDVRRAVAGFGDPVILLVAALFVVGEGLARSGVADALSDRMLKLAGKGEARQVVLLMVAAGVVGSAMSSTATVALLMPVALRIAAQSRRSPSGLLMPLAYAGLVSGMMTLIATTPNLVVSAQLVQEGHAPFSMFEFTPIGVAVMLVAIAWMLTGGRRLLPTGATPPDADAPMQGLIERFALDGHIHVAAVGAESPLGRRRLDDLRLQPERGITVLAIRRRDGIVDTVVAARADAMLLPGDLVAIECATDAYLRAVADGILSPVAPDEGKYERWRRGLGIAEVIVAPESPLAGQTLADATFTRRFDLHVVAIRRVGQALTGRVSTKPLAAGDTLLVAGAWDRIAKLRDATRELVVASVPFEAGGPAPDARRATAALAIMIAMVVVMALNLTAPVIVAICAALAMVALRVVSMEEAYRSVSWRTIVLIAGLLPLADALGSTGLLMRAADAITSVSGASSPVVLQSILFLMTALLGSILSNTATAVIMAPLAIDVATRTGASPAVMGMTVAIACSAGFHTPISSPVVTLVAVPGGYRFLDYVKVGVPLLALTWLVCLTVLPLVVRG